MQALASHNPGNFHGATPDPRIGEQHFAQWATTQLGQPAAPTVQGSSRNQRPGKHPGLVAAEQVYFASPSPSIQP
jgi:hypothetical protein